MNLGNIKEKILDFRNKRDWKQFHDPKNLAIAMSIESSELLELFLWKSRAESRKVVKDKKEKMADELADILTFAILFAHEVDINIEEAILSKLKKNDKKYPVNKSKGLSKKYTELE